MLRCGAPHLPREHLLRLLFLSTLRLLVSGFEVPWTFYRTSQGKRRWGGGLFQVN